MNWIFVALLSQLVLTVVIFNDKFIISERVGDFRPMPVYNGIVGLLIGLILWAVGGFEIIALRDAGIILLSGMLTVWASYLYFNAISQEQGSSVIVLFQMMPIFTLVLSFLFLDEVITLPQLFGFILILGSAVVVSLEGGAGAFRLSKAFFLIVGVDVMISAANVLFKFVSGEYSFATLTAYSNWGLALGGLALYLAVPSIREAFNHNLRTVPRLTIGLVFLNESMFVVGRLLSLLAIKLGPVSLVSVIGGTQVFFGILLGWLLTVVAPGVFAEDIKPASLLRKGGLATLVVLGVVLVG